MCLLSHGASLQWRPELFASFRFRTALVLVLCTAALLANAQTPRKPAGDVADHDQVGRRLLEKRDWKAAAAEFDQCIKLNPRAVDAYIGRGIALWGLHDRQGAFQAFQQATAADPKSAEAHFNVGVALKDSGENERAANELKTALQLKPNYDEAELLLALLLQQTGRPDDAIAQYQHLLKRTPSSVEAHNWLGVAYLQKNALVEAQAEFRQAIQLKPDFARAYNNLGSTLAQAGDIEEGIRALEKGLKLAPRDVQLRINLGMALRSKGDAEAALTLFRSLLGDQPDSPELLYQVGQTLRQKGDLQGAIQSFEKALELSPEAREAYYGLGQALKEAAATARRKQPSRRPAPATAGLLKAGTQAMARGDLSAARDLFQRAVETDPECAEAHNMLGFVLGRGRDLPAAIDSLNRAIALDPNLADAHYNLGVALWYQGDRAKSAAELDTALRLNPTADNAYGFRGMTLRETGDLNRARQMLIRAIAVNPQNPVPYIDLGTVFLRLAQLEHALGQFEAGLNLPVPPGSIPDLGVAIADLRQAVSQNPGADAYNILGRLLGVAGADSPPVIAAFQEAIRLRPDYAEAYNNMGLVYLQTGEDEPAIAAFRKAVELRPDYADAHQNLGAILTSSDAAEAVRELETAVSLQPRLLKAQYNLALAYEASSAHGAVRASEQLRKLLAMEPRFPRAEFALGRSLLRQGKVSDAIEHLRLAVEQDPEYGEARYQYGLALSRAGRRAEGAAEIQKGRELIAASEKQQAARLDMVEASTAIDQGNLDQAIPKIKRVLRTWPDAAEPHYLLGKALDKKGDSQEAIAEFRKALEIDPGHAQAKASLDRLSSPSVAGDDPQRIKAMEDLIRIGKFEAAEGAIRAYIGEHPKSSWAWYALGYSLYGQRKIGESIRALAQSLQLNVRNADAHKLLGRNMIIIGRFDAARTEFEQGALFDPKSAEMPYNLGKLCSIQDNWPDARRHFETAVRLDPEYMEAYDGLGLALESLGDDDGAIASYKKAITLNEARKATFASPYVNLSSLSNRTGNRDTALEYARKALEVNPKSDGALFQLAKAQEAKGDLASAAESLNQAISINSRTSSYFYVLGTVYRKLGKFDESKQAMESFRKLDRESNELEQKRRTLAREGDKANRPPQP